MGFWRPTQLGVSVDPHMVKYTLVLIEGECGWFIRPALSTYSPPSINVTPISVNPL
jgi:hypothetical protein